LQRVAAIAQPLFAPAPTHRGNAVGGRRHPGALSRLRFERLDPRLVIPEVSVDVVKARVHFPKSCVHSCP
jgi:hypothetical protein